MDNKLKLLRLYHLAAAYVVCVSVYCLLLQNQFKRKRTEISPDITEESERIRRGVRSSIANDARCREICRMSPSAFAKWCNILVTYGGLRPTRRASVEEQVINFMGIVGLGLRNRRAQGIFRRSGETISRYFHNVLNAVIEVEGRFLQQPDGSQVPTEIYNSQQYYPYFKDCVGTIDGTHIRVKVSPEVASRYRSKKEFSTQNVMAACTFDLKFTYVLAGWEGSASDSRILKDALRRRYPLRIPQGKFYLVDVGFMTTSGLITPYKRVRYYLRDYSSNPPRNYRELFNFRHTFLRNTIERAFGMLKKRFPIISSSDEPFFCVETHTKIILACCVIHNYLMGEDLNEDFIRQVDDELANEPIEVNSGGGGGDDDNDDYDDDDDDDDETQQGESIRDAIALAMWRDYTSKQ